MQYLNSALMTGSNPASPFPYPTCHQERLLAWEAQQAALETEQDGLSEQAYYSASAASRTLGTQRSSWGGGGDGGGGSSVSFFDGSSLESLGATFVDLDASSVGTYASYDASLGSQVRLCCVCASGIELLLQAARTHRSRLKGKG